MGRIDQARAADMLRFDARRDVYEAGDVSGKRGIGEFYVTYSNGQSPKLSRADVDQMVRDGLLLPHPEVSGMFKRGPRL